MSPEERNPVTGETEAEAVGRRAAIAAMTGKDLYMEQTQQDAMNKIMAARVKALQQAEAQEQQAMIDDLKKTFAALGQAAQPVPGSTAFNDNEYEALKTAAKLAKIQKLYDAQSDDDEMKGAPMTCAHTRWTIRDRDRVGYARCDQCMQEIPLLPALNSLQIEVQKLSERLISATNMLIARLGSEEYWRQKRQIPEAKQLPEVQEGRFMDPENP